MVDEAANSSFHLNIYSQNLTKKLRYVDLYPIQGHTKNTAINTNFIVSKNSSVLPKLCSFIPYM